MTSTTSLKANDHETTQAQRLLVYSLTGLLVVTAWIVEIAFRDPCNGAPGICNPTMGQRLPPMTDSLTLLIIMAGMVAAYESRWTLRVVIPALVGVGLLVTSALLYDAAKPMLLIVVTTITGLTMISMSEGIRRGHRAAWAFATVILAVLTLIFFFSSARLQRGLDVSLVVAVLPSLAFLLPLTVAMATTAPHLLDADGNPIHQAANGGGSLSGTRHVVVGLGFLALGLAITTVSYTDAASSPRGGNYVIMLGPIAYGIASIIRGLTRR